MLQEGRANDRAVVLALRQLIEEGGGGGVGARGYRGWSPVLGYVQDNSRVVARVTDWTGGEGTKPTVSGYVGPNGIVTNIAQAVDIRGLPGNPGAPGAPGPAGPPGNDNLTVDVVAPTTPQNGDVWIDTSIVTEGNAIPISSLAIGSTVVDKSWTYLGEPVKFLVVAHNHHLKDSGYPTNATTLHTKHVICIKSFDAYEPTNPNTIRQAEGNNRYAVSNISQWLDSDSTSWFSPQHEYDASPSSPRVSANPFTNEPGFLTNMSAGFKDAILPATIQTALYSLDGTGIESVSRRVYLPGAREIRSQETRDGETFTYFEAGTAARLRTPTASAVANNTHTATGAPAVGVGCIWFSRSYHTSSASTAAGVTADGSAFEFRKVYAGGLTGICPIVNVKNSLWVSVTPNVDGDYEIIHEGAIEGGPVTRTWLQNVLINGEWVPGGNAPVTQMVTQNFVTGAMNKEPEPIFVKTSGTGFSAAFANTGDQPYHPDILYFANRSQFGYHYIMAYTPYPVSGMTGSRDRYECPCIVGSNNLVDWEVPIGLTNPVDDLTSAEISAGAYFSDPFLVYNPTTQKIELYYRLTANKTTYATTLLRKVTTTTSSIGAWTARETLLDVSDGASNGLGGMVRSATAHYGSDGLFHMWYGQSPANVFVTPMYHSTSPNGKDGWTTPQQCVLNGGRGSTWHPSVKFYAGQYHLVNYNHGTAFIEYYTSPNGINFTFQKILIQGKPNTFYTDLMYRSDCVYNGNTWSVVFTAEGLLPRAAKFGLLQGPNMMSLQLLDGDYWGRRP